MLQQTQVATVIPYYIEWLRRFPDFATLAAAEESEVLHAWQGLGYYSRARNLHAAAKALGSRSLSSDVTAIRALPGVGRYTANAVATFAFDQAVPIVEANTARVLTRLFNIRASIQSTAGQRELWSAAESLLPKDRAGEHNSALMDLGATVCTARAPNCPACPVKRFCRAPDPALIPIKQQRAAIKTLTEHHGFATQNGDVLLEQSTTRWRGLWILPRIAPPPPRTIEIHRSVFPFTNHKITLSVSAHEQHASSPETRWFSRKALSRVPMPSPHRRALDALLPLLS